jgi:hypothetical protein
MLQTILWSETTNMALRYCAYTLDNEGRLRYSCGADRQHSLDERKRLFSVAAQALVSEMLNKSVEIREDDILLETENGGAIHVSEHVSSHATFQKMLAETSCLSILKTLAVMAMWGEKND